MEVSKDWQPCTRCESKRVAKVSKAAAGFLGFICVSGGIWLSLVIPPAGMFVIFLGIMIMLFGWLSPTMLKCKDCNNMWKPEIKK